MSISAPMSIAASGLKTAGKRFEAATSALAQSTASPVGDGGQPTAGVTYGAVSAGDGVVGLAASGNDLAGAMADLLAARISYAASAKVMKVADSLEKSAIDMLG